MSQHTKSKIPQKKSIQKGFGNSLEVFWKMNSVQQVWCSCVSTPSSMKYRYYSSSTTTTTRKSKFPKPSKIPFQPKLANSVNLIGTVNKHFHLQTTHDGNPLAATVITRFGHDPPSFFIHVVFQGDLAHTANFHLKLNDLVLPCVLM
jgi:hypothetical protein